MKQLVDEKFRDFSAIIERRTENLNTETQVGTGFQTEVRDVETAIQQETQAEFRKIKTEIEAEVPIEIRRVEAQLKIECQRLEDERRDMKVGNNLGRQSKNLTVCLTIYPLTTGATAMECPMKLDWHMC